MIVALYGASCTGKSTLARLLIDKWKCPYRSCGDLVRESAEKLNLMPHQLPEEVHRLIDTQTIEWVRQVSNSGGVLDGRFLNYVLYPVRDLVEIVELVTAPTKRMERLVIRKGKLANENDLKNEDLADNLLSNQLYADMNKLVPGLSIDTTGGTNECLVVLEPYLKKQSLIRD